MAQRLTHKDVQRFKKARTAFLQNRADEAVRLYEKLHQRNPDHVPITTELAQIYGKLRIIEPADRLLRQLMQHHYAQGRIMVLVGRTYNLIRDYASALKAYQLALQCELPSDVEVGVRTEIALASERTNDLVKAQVQVDQLLKSAPDLATISRRSSEANTS